MEEIISNFAISFIITDKEKWVTLDRTPYSKPNNDPPIITPQSREEQNLSSKV